MWYVIYAGGGKEERTLKLIKRYLANARVDETHADAPHADDTHAGTLHAGDTQPLIQDAFVLYSELPWHSKGTWSRVTRPTLAGYIFVKTRRPQELAAQLRSVPALTRLLGSSDSFTPLSAEESKWLELVSADDQHIMGMSEAVKTGDQVRVVSGPLKGFEGNIRRIDAHHRIAEVGLEFMGRNVTMRLGCEIIRKE